MYDRQGKTDQGLSAMESILKINPDNADALNYIGYTWTTRGERLDDAERLLKHALTLRPDNAFIQDSWGWYLFTRGRLSESVVQLEKAVKLKPNESTILEHLADAYLRANLEEKAYARYGEAVRFAEDSESKQKLEAKVVSLRRVLVQKGKMSPTEYAQEYAHGASQSSKTARSQDRVPAEEGESH
jgi:Flp pilus assembly protein TadD